MSLVFPVRIRAVCPRQARSSEAEQGAFNPKVEISKFSGPTIEPTDYEDYIESMANADFDIVKQYVGGIYPEFDHLSPEQIDALRVEAFDRWTFESEDETDLELFNKLDEELRARKKVRTRTLNANWRVEAAQDLQAEFGEGGKEELEQALTEQIRKEIEEAGLETVGETALACFDQACREGTLQQIDGKLVVPLVKKFP